jgi:hypothetical protein
VFANVRGRTRTAPFAAALHPPARKRARLGAVPYLHCSWTRRCAADKHALAKEVVMLWTIAVIFLILWALGLVSSYTLGGFVHLLLVLAVIVLVVGLIQRRRVI